MSDGDGQNEIKNETEAVKTEQILNNEIKPEENQTIASEPAVPETQIPVPEINQEIKTEPPIQTEPVNSAEDPQPSQDASAEIKASKTIEKSGDTVTITEIMTPPAETPRVSPDTKFPAPFVQKDLWQKFLNKLSDRKNKRLGRILKFIDEKTLRHGSGQVTNDEVEKLLHVSDATATRYLDQLEKEGKIRQVGKTGKYTHYTSTSSVQAEKI